MMIQKITKSILFVLTGAIVIICIEVSTYEDTSIPSQSKDLDDLHESHIDQRVNYHLDQLSRKVQLQKLKAQSVAKEVELLRISPPRLHHRQVDFDKQNDKTENLKISKYTNITDQVDAHINDIELEARQQALMEQEDKKRRAELIKSYQERARKAGFEMVIKEGQILGIRKKNSFH